MTSDLHDPSSSWSHHLQRLSGQRLHSVTEALRHSVDTGWPPSDESVRLLVAYAVGDITSRQYVAGILAASHVPAPVAPVPVAPVAQPAAVRPAAAPVRREDAVAAYVSGEIPVSEFLRIARSEPA